MKELIEEKGKGRRYGGRKKKEGEKEEGRRKKEER